MTRCRIVVIFVGLLFAEACCLANPESASLSFAADGIQVNSNAVILDYGHVIEGSAFQTELFVTNRAEHSRTIDVFVQGANIRAVWVNATRKNSTRILIGPHDKAELSITAIAKPAQTPSIIFMESWKELGFVDILYVTSAHPLEETFRMPPIGWFTSSMGKDLAKTVTYRVCAPEPPPGLVVFEASPALFASPTDTKDGDPRGCFTWAECTSVEAQSGESICYRLWVQGHSEGDAHANDRTVQFAFSLSVKYAPARPRAVIKSRSEFLKTLK